MARKKRDPAEEILRIAKSRGVSEEKLKRADYLFKRGMTINNPHIPMKLIRERATALKPNDPEVARRQVKAFIAKRPLGQATSG